MQEKIDVTKSSQKAAYSVMHSHIRLKEFLSNVLEN